MIPSRPLDFSGILNESVRIIKETWWRSAAVLILCSVLGIAMFTNGIISLLDGFEHLTKQYTDVSGENFRLFRDYAVLGMEKPRNISIYRIEFPTVMNTLDSVRTSLLAQYPDSSARAALKARVDSLSSAISIGHQPLNADDFLDSIMPGLIWLMIGGVVVLLGTIAETVANFDIACRAFEQRPIRLGKVFSKTFTRWLWLQLVQYFLILLAMALGLGVVVGITASISTGLGVLGMLFAFGLIAYALIRMSFSSVALVSEDLGPIAAVKRSFELTAGSWWRVFGYFFLGGMIVMIIGTLIRIPFSFGYSFDIYWLVRVIQAVPGSLHEFIGGLRSYMTSYFWAMLIPSALLASFWPAFATTFYYEMRTRHDGPLDYYGKAETLTGPPTPPDSGAMSIGPSSSETQDTPVQPPETN